MVRLVVGRRCVLPWAFASRQPLVVTSASDHAATSYAQGDRLACISFACADDVYLPESAVPVLMVHLVVGYLLSNAMGSCFETTTVRD